MANDDFRKIAIYGKGGIGKSTISSNVSAALSVMGETVMQVGCDPKRDSISTLCGRLMPTVLDQMRERGRVKDIDAVIHRGFNGVLGVESGGPRPGKGCAGRGVNTALQILERFKVFEKYDLTVAIFDVLGDVVCGGFSAPIRSGFAPEAYLVTCGEALTLYQVANIALSIKAIHDQGADTAIAGIIDNQRGVKNETEIVEEYAERLGVPVIHHIPRSRTVQDAEFQGKTVIEALPESEQAQEYKALAEKIMANETRVLPNVVTLKEVKEIVAKYS